MANAGNHYDTVLLKSMIHNGYLLKIYSTDHLVIRLIKLRFNDVVRKDEAYNAKSGKYKYVWHYVFETTDAEFHKHWSLTIYFS